MLKLPLRFEQQSQTSGACIDRRDAYGLHANNLPEFWIYDADNHLIAVTFVNPDLIIKGLNSGKDTSGKTPSSSKHEGSGNARAKKEALR